MRQQNNSCLQSSSLSQGQIIYNYNKQKQINKRMYQKYSSSQNYFYCKSVNEIIDDKISTANIKYSDWIFYDQEQEFLRRFYHQHEYNKKMKGSISYYRYHKNVARFFEKSIMDLYLKWNQRKKKHLYNHIKKLLDEEQTQKQQNDYTKFLIKNMTNILGQISQYNPKSNNYYLKNPKSKNVNNNLHKFSNPKQTQELNSIIIVLNRILKECNYLQDVSNFTDTTENIQIQSYEVLNNQNEVLKKTNIIQDLNFKKKNNLENLVNQKAKYTLKKNLWDTPHQKKILNIPKKISNVEVKVPKKIFDEKEQNQFKKTLFLQKSRDKYRKKSQAIKKQLLSPFKLNQNFQSQRKKTIYQLSSKQKEQKKKFQYENLMTHESEKLIRYENKKLIQKKNENLNLQTQNQFIKSHRHRDLLKSNDLKSYSSVKFKLKNKIQQGQKIKMILDLKRQPK